MFVPPEWALLVFLLLSEFAAGVRSLASAACDSGGAEALFEVSSSIELATASLLCAEKYVSSLSCDGAKPNALLRSSGTLLHAHRVRRSNKTNGIATVFSCSCS